MGEHPMKYQAAGVLGIALIVLATALGGVKTIGYSSECTDGVDNDGETDVDLLDNECFFYPFSDGAGESPGGGALFEGQSYASLFDYHVLYSDPADVEANICFGDALGMYQNVQGDQQKFDDYVLENNVSCQGQGP